MIFLVAGNDFAVARGLVACCSSVLVIATWWAAREIAPESAAVPRSRGAGGDQPLRPALRGAGDARAARRVALRALPGRLRAPPAHRHAGDDRGDRRSQRGALLHQVQLRSALARAAAAQRGLDGVRRAARRLGSHACAGTAHRSTPPLHAVRRALPCGPRGDRADWRRHAATGGSSCERHLDRQSTPLAGRHRVGARDVAASARVGTVASWERSLAERHRVLLWTIAIPAAAWLLLPPHLRSFLDFVENRSSGPALSSAAGLLFYPRVFVEQYHARSLIGMTVMVGGRSSGEDRRRGTRGQDAAALRRHRSRGAHPPSLQGAAIPLIAAPVLWLAAAWNLVTMVERALAAGRTRRVDASEGGGVGERRARGGRARCGSRGASDRGVAASFVRSVHGPERLWPAARPHRRSRRGEAHACPRDVESDEPGAGRVGLVAASRDSHGRATGGRRSVAPRRSRRAAPPSLARRERARADRAARSRCRDRALDRLDRGVRRRDRMARAVAPRSRRRRDAVRELSRESLTRGGYRVRVFRLDRRPTPASSRGG